MSTIIVLVVILIILIIIIAIGMCSWTYAKPKVMKYVTNKIMQNLPPMEQNPAELNLNYNRTSARLNYTHKGKEHILYIPYDKKLLRKVGYTVFHELNETKVDITQEPGVPYLVTANMLGGGEIKVYKDDELVNTFKEDDHIKF